MSEYDYLMGGASLVEISKAFNPIKAFKAGRVARTNSRAAADWAKSPAAANLKRLQASNAYTAHRAAGQAASDAAMGQRVAASAAARRKAAAGVMVPSRKPPPQRYRRPGGDTGGGPGWIGSGNS